MEYVFGEITGSWPCKHMPEAQALFLCASLENNGIENKALAICWKEISNEVSSFTLLLAPTKAKVDKRARIKVKHIKQIYQVYTYFSKWKYFVSSALFIPEGLITEQKKFCSVKLSWITSMTLNIQLLHYSQ